MNIFQITVFTSISITIESYDIVICSLLVKQLGANFFTAFSPRAQIMLVYAILVAAYLVSPISSLITGFLGDRRGRKTIIVNTQIWMTVCTFLVGLLPTYQQIGALAGVLLAMLRITQNLLVGGDFPGAATYLLEHASPQKRGLYFGLMMGILGFGSSLASGVVALLVKWIPPAAFSVWGFRLPFLFGGLLGIVGIIIRRMLPESPEFLAYINKATSSAPINLGHVFKRIWRPALLVIGTALGPLCVSTFKSTMPVTLESFYHFHAADIYLAMSIVYFSSGFLKMFFGWLSDFVGYKAIALASSLLLLIGAVPLFTILRTGSAIAPYLFIFYLQIVTALSASSMTILIAACFPIQVRYAGAALSNSVANMFAAFMPIFTQLNYGFWHTELGVASLFMALAMLSIYSLNLLVKRYELT